VERRFTQPGVYTVTLTVWDVEGFSDSLSNDFLVPDLLCVR
jgi:PKD repeat protein